MSEEVGRFERILVPVDFTPESRKALDVAVDLARAGRSEILLVHVIEEVPHLSEAELRPFYDRLEREAWRDLECLAGDLERGGVAVVREILFGRRAPEILRHAGDCGADLIVLGSKPLRDRPAEGAWGTVGQQVAIIAPCSVLLVRSA